MKIKYLFRSLISLLLIAFLTGCQGLEEINNEALEVRHLADGIKELVNSTRGSIEIESVDFVCGYAV